MKILHLTPYYAPAYAYGGVVRAAQGMAGALAQRPHAVTVLTTDTLNQQGHRLPAGQSDHNGIRVWRVPNVLPALRGRLNFSTPRGLRKVANALLDECDMLHIHEFRTVENVIVTRAAAERGVPVVCSPHGTLALHTGRSRLKRAWDRWFSPYVAARTDAVIALTDAECSDASALWQTFWPRQRPLLTAVVPNGVDPQAFAHLPSAAVFRQRWQLGDARVVLFMGRLHPRKGALLLAHAFLDAHLPDARLVIAGPDEGDTPALRALNDPRIVLTGYLEGEERLAALAAADLFVLPALGEGMSMAVLEAMAAGVPVIISPECHLPQVMTYGAGLVVLPQKAGLIAALRETLADEAMRQAMGRQGRALVQEHFTWASAAAALERVYQQVLELRA